MEHIPLYYDAPTVLPTTESSRMEHSVLLNGHGGLDKIEVKRSPLATELKEYEVEVEVYYCGLNFTDNYLRLGIISNRDFPVIMGSECSGIVMQVGAGVKDLRGGEGVLLLRMHGGLFRRAVVVPRSSCFRLPDNLSLRSAAALGLSSLVAHVCLFEKGRLRENQKVFMHSVAGGVGTSVVQLARTVQNVTILGTASETKHEKAVALGVKRIFRHEDNYVDEILKEYPEGVDIIINSIGGRAMEKCLKFLKPGGKLINIDFAVVNPRCTSSPGSVRCPCDGRPSTEKQVRRLSVALHFRMIQQLMSPDTRGLRSIYHESYSTNSSATYPRAVTWRRRKPEWDSRSICTTPLFRKSQSVAGLDIGYWLEKKTRKVQSILDHIFYLRSFWKIKPCIHCRIDIEQAATALEQLCTRKNFGKVILVAQEEPYLLNQPGHRISSPTETIPGNSPLAKREDNSGKRSAQEQGAEDEKKIKTIESQPKGLENITGLSVGEHS